MYPIPKNDLTEAQISTLTSYMDEVLRINESINLTAIRDRDEFWLKHIWDSIHPVADMVEIPSPVLDLGTGGGFPLIPLAVTFPESHFVGIDSVNKKLNVIRQTAGSLHVDNVELIHGRAEDLAREPKLREHFGLVVSRAVAELRILLEYVVPFVRVGGWIYAYKSVEVEQEIRLAQKAIEVLGVEMMRQVDYSLPGESQKRSLLMFQKKRATDRRFPRKAGIPKKSPL